MMNAEKNRTGHDECAFDQNQQINLPADTNEYREERPENDIKSDLVGK